jgi:hypothetical protein
MAGEDSGGLLVQIGVTQARMERELAKLVKDASKSAGAMEKSFDAANTNIGKGAQRAFSGISTGSQQAAGSVRSVTGAASNLSYQLNDIGVQLAGGQSPFLIMLQQGTQISQIFNQTGGSIKSFGSILAGAVSSVLNPFSLLTFAVIGLGGYAVQAFMEMTSGGEEANKAVEEQAKLIENVAKRWGEAVPELQAYIDRLAVAKEQTELLAAVDILSKQKFEPVKAEIDKLSIDIAELVQQLTTVGADPSTIVALQTAFNDVATAARDGTDASAELQALQDALAAAFTQTGIPAANSLAGVIASLGESFYGAARQADGLRASAIQALIAGQNLAALPPIFSDGGKFFSGDDFKPTGDTPKPDSRPSDLDRVTDAEKRRDALQNDEARRRRILRENNTPEFAAPTPESRPLIELDGLPGTKYGGGRGGSKRAGGGSKSDSYASEVQGIKERTVALRESTAAQAAINPLVSDFGFALEKAQVEQKLLADAQREGMAITPALREQISELATGYATASADAKKLSESQKEIKKNAEEWASLEKDVFKGFISDLKDGKSGAEALSNALNKVADKLLDMAVDGIFSTKGGATGGGGSGLFGSILGGIGKIFGFASGTAKTPGRRGQPAGIVHGEEAVIPLPAGGKVPVTISSPTVQQGKSSRDVVELRLADDSGRMAEIADQQIRTSSGTIVKIAVDQSYKAVKSNMGGLMTDTQSRQF